MTRLAKSPPTPPTPGIPFKLSDHDLRQMDEVWQGEQAERIAGPGREEHDAAP
jgi:hypothetical protein